MALSFTQENENNFQNLLGRFPEDKRKAALIPALQLAQTQWGHLTEEVMTYVAERLGLAAAEVMNTATFYTMLRKKPVGEFHIQVCTNLSCYLRGSDQLMGLLEGNLGIKCGQTTDDGKFTLDHVECLASCGTAPMMQVNDNYYENLTPGLVEELLAKWRRESDG